MNSLWMKNEWNSYFVYKNRVFFRFSGVYNSARICRTRRWYRVESEVHELETNRILDLETGIYNGTMNGEKVQIRRVVGCGFEVVHAPNNEGYRRVVRYDERGNIKGTTTEKH